MKHVSSFFASTILAGLVVALPAASATAAPVRYEAEAPSATCSGTLDADHAGYSGTGFCNGSNAVGAAAQFTVDAAASGTATVGVRYASGTTTSRPTDLIVNGSRTAAVSFESTGSWTTWMTKTLTVQVKSGSNTIRLNPTTAEGLPNIDYLDLEITAGATTGTGVPSDPNLQYYGRWNRSNSSYYSMGWAGGYLDARFTGTSVGVRQRNTVDLYYSIDGHPLQWRRNVSGNVTIATGLSGTSHTIRIGYRERAGSYTGDPVFGGLILAGGGQTIQVTRPRNFVEFIGDSITVGQPNANRPFTAYPWLTAEALGAGHTQVAQGGACLVSQQGCYGMMDWFRRSSAWVSNDDWNFSTYQATGVVINLGTNDVGHGVSTAQFQQNYIVLLERVRKAYPAAHIFAMGTFRNRYVPETRNAVAARTAAGDTLVHFVDTTGWITTGDTVDNVHPTEAGHLKITQRLTPILHQYL